MSLRRHRNPAVTARCLTVLLSNASQLQPLPAALTTASPCSPHHSLSLQPSLQPLPAALTTASHCCPHYSLSLQLS
eukprot:349906-Chlamydomonas_euryale.AAC.9